MKTKLFCFLILSLCLFSISSCKDSDDNTSTRGQQTVGDDEYVNNWIMDSMSTYYLWNDHLPNRTSLDFSTKPNDFFKSLLSYEAELLNKGGHVFSNIDLTHANIPKSSSISDLGFEFVTIRFMNQAGVTLYYRYIVTYVKKGTDAEKQGLKRGYLISEVNGTAVAEDTWSSLLFNNESSYKLKCATNEANNANGIYIEKTINTTPNYTDSPIFLDSIYTEGSRKIGYVVYNSFEAGGESTLPYDVQLSEIFTKFKQQNVTDLVVDLRYNGGGLVRSAKFITSALVPNRDTKNIFEVKTYNTEIQTWLNGLDNNSRTKQSWMYEYFTDNIQNTNGNVLASIPRLGDQLNSICFIVTGYTASSSEMTINTLKPYMDDAGKNLYLIGERTVGKNVGSWAIYENNNSKNTYVIWPITFQSHNKLYPSDQSSAYGSGFTPTEEVDDFDMLSVGLKDLGDKEETMLKASIAKIMGYSTLSQKSTSNTILKISSSLDRKHKLTGGMYIDENELKKVNINTLNSSKAK
ncbi:MAG: S41 family peptidase [Dysgonomonas sp.]